MAAARANQHGAVLDVPFGWTGDPRSRHSRHRHARGQHVETGQRCVHASKNRGGLYVEGRGKSYRFVRRPWGCFGLAAEANVQECRQPQAGGPPSADRDRVRRYLAFFADSDCRL